jgi:hypothetical protein
MKSWLLLAAGLLLASAAQAQNSHQIVANGGGSAGVGTFGIGGWGGGGPWGSSNSAARHHQVVYEEPREFEIGYAVNDGPFVPSTYMNYEDALALGRQQLAEAERAATGNGNGQSLGEAARAYRIVKVPTMRLRSRVLQDNAGRLQVCNLNGNACRLI